VNAPLVWADMQEVDERALRSKFERLLASIVAADSISTRSDDRLNQICNVLLLKLESDRIAKIRPSEPVPFQVSSTEAQTAANIVRLHEDLVRRYPQVFPEASDQRILLDDHYSQSSV
jgi:hypothetical protein